MIARALAARLRKLAVEGYMTSRFNRYLSVAIDRVIVEIEQRAA